ncbi:MAG: hypothetical protein J6T70_04110 [Bacteroidales bacterium]|nr:hypothetical protein [Bacteroidales bacterium]
MNKNTKFSSYYNSVVNKKIRTNLRNRILTDTGVSYGCFRMWVKGTNKIPTIYHAAIAAIMGVPVSELFPKSTNYAETVII